MTRNPPRFPRPAILQRIFLTPPDSGIRSPDSGSDISVRCKLAYSSSDRYRSTSFENNFVSMKLNTANYTSMTDSVNSVLGFSEHGSLHRLYVVRRLFKKTMACF